MNCQYCNFFLKQYQLLPSLQSFICHLLAMRAEARLRPLNTCLWLFAFCFEVEEFKSVWSVWTFGRVDLTNV